MAGIHIIYDPEDNVSVPDQEWIARTKVSLVYMRLPEIFDLDEVVDKLITELMVGVANADSK